MSEEQIRIAEEVKKREQDIEIMQLLLKHRLTKKRAEYKILVMYYKACNMIAKAKLVMLGTDDNGIKPPHLPQPPNNIKQVYRWCEQFERRASNL